MTHSVESTTWMRAYSDLEQRVLHLGESLDEAIGRAHRAEQRVGQLSQLVAVVTQLHHASDVEEVLTTVKEAVANMIGCERMGIYRVTHPGPILTLIDAIGLDADEFAAIPGVSGPVADALAGHRPVLDLENTGLARMGGQRLNACVPFIGPAGVFGMLVLFELVIQKPVLEPADGQLLEFIGAHASIALLRMSGGESLTLPDA